MNICEEIKKAEKQWKENIQGKSSAYYAKMAFRVKQKAEGALDRYKDLKIKPSLQVLESILSSFEQGDFLYAQRLLSIYLLPYEKALMEKIKGES